MKTIREYLYDFDNRAGLQIPDSSVLDLTVESVQFPTTEEQNDGIALVIRTEDGPMHVRFNTNAHDVWQSRLEDCVRMGGSRNEHVMRHGPDPLRSLELVRSLAAKGPQR